jgi:hypothetical protein
MLELLFKEIYDVLKSLDEKSKQVQHEEALRFLTDVFVNLSFDYNVLLRRNALQQQSASYRQWVTEILTSWVPAVNPNVQASFDYGVAETYHVLKRPARAIEYARKVLSVTDHPLSMFAQRLVIINICYINYAQAGEEITLGRKMLASIGEDAQLREGIAQAEALNHHNRAWRKDLGKVMQVGMSGQPIIHSMGLRTKMEGLNIFYPRDTKTKVKTGCKLIEGAMLHQLEKYYEQAVEIGRKGGVEFWIDEENNVYGRKIT